MTLLAVAPMLDWSDRHYRFFMRQISKSVILYTEMIVADAIIHGDVERLLGYSPEEHPLVVQLGGSDPHKLALASKKCAEYGYDEININIGCPSERVKSGNFGACLMQEPMLVADCVKSMQDAALTPVTVKHRIGIDHVEEYGFVRDFVGIVAAAGCKHFIVHARNAILSGLSPKQNREIPPLKYDYVYKLKQDFPELMFTLNGGVKTVTQIQEHLQHVDGVMLGREAYHNPYLLSTFDHVFGKEGACGSDEIPGSRIECGMTNLLSAELSLQIKSREEIAQSMLPYLHAAAQQNIPLHRITRHMIGLYHGCPNAKIWRHTLTNTMIQESDIKLYESLLV